MDGGLTRREARALRNAVRAVRALDVERGLDGEAVASCVAESLHELTGWPSACMRQERTEAGWELGFFGGHGLPPGFRREYAVNLERTPVGFFAYDPLRPSPEERNVVRDATLSARRVPAAHAFFEQKGLPGAQTRVLVCDGPLLLAWVGSIRPPGANDNRDRLFVGRVALAARHALRLARGFGASAVHASLEAAVEVYPGEMYFVTRDGRIQLTNEYGAQRLRRDASSLLSAIRESLATRERPSPFRVVPVRARGMGALFLLTRSPHPEAEGRVAEARARWGLTPRQGEVLARLALGDANKDIASRLQMSVRTVEQHVATILRLAKVESRTGLVAKVWTL
jgi:DNA-binding CsgD family transcriptional regulator